MSVSFLPKTFDPRRLAEGRITLEGDLKVDCFERLAAQHASAGDVVDLRIDFLRDEAGRIILRGGFSTVLTLQCQRCLESFNKPYTAEFHVAAVPTEASAKKLPDDLDAIVTNGEPVELKHFIEEDILLNLPLIPMHEGDSCGTLVQVEPEEFKVNPEKKNPFQVLEKLLEER